jgi:parvulin-like peptidyl-prolyl isomerase
MPGKDAIQRKVSVQSAAAHLSISLIVFFVCALWQGFWPADVSAQVPVPRRRAPQRNAAPTARTARVPQGATQPGLKSHLKVLAVVNGQQITRQQFADECVRRYGKDVLESMLNKHLILQECRRRSIMISEGDVEAEIESMASKFQLPVDRWLSLLERERNISADKYRREIIWPTLALRRLAAERIVVGDDQIREAFEAEYGPKVKARMIAVSSREKAEAIRRKAIANPDRFGDIAKDESEDAHSAAARGLITPIRKNAGHDELEQIAFALKEGEISPVIAVVNQYLILKCEGHLAENYIAPEQIARVKLQLHDQLRDQKLRVTAGEIFQQLQENAQVVNLLKDPTQRPQHPGKAALVNGQPITMLQLSEEALLRHGKDVLDGEINRMLLTQELKKQRKVVTNESIDQEIARAAVAYGHVDANDRPDVDSWLKVVTESDDVSVELYVHDAVWPSVALKLLVRDDISVTREDMEKGFAANYGERVEVLTIVLSNQRTANSVWEMARGNPTDQFFGELASQYSVEPISKSNFGKIPPIRRFGGQPIIENEAFSLEPGVLSSILSVADKYIILRCLGRTKPVVQEFAAVESELRKEIHEKRLRLAMAEEFDRLKETAQIDNFLEGSSQPGSQLDRRANRRAPTSGGRTR